MADRSYTVNAPTTSQADVVAVDVIDGHGLSVWGYGVVIKDGNGNPTGRLEWGWWEFQWLEDSSHPRGGLTLAALQALNPANADPNGVLVTYEDVE